MYLHSHLYSEGTRAANTILRETLQSSYANALVVKVAIR